MRLDRFSTLSRAIVEFVEECPFDVGFEEIAEDVNAPVGHVRKYAARLCNQGLIRRVSRGRYAKADTPPSNDNDNHVIRVLS